MLPKNPLQNNPPAGKKFSIPQRFGINKPGEKTVAKPGVAPLGGLKMPAASQPAIPAGKSSALQPLRIKPAKELEEGKENEEVMIERLLKELDGYRALYKQVSPTTQKIWDDVKIRARAQNDFGKSQLIADLRALINKLESMG